MSEFCVVLYIKIFFHPGDVKFAEIVLDKGKSTGVGYVRFGNEMDAQRAVSILFFLSSREKKIMFFKLSKNSNNLEIKVNWILMQDKFTIKNVL